ncbi:heterokaryon incompatibility protein-domain-containing protein [Xylogone sp. PMI_703]|nr:heterokaryon incompatibility protein-domain-containing protein [Xylogone sp. PMI_703]
MTSLQPYEYLDSLIIDEGLETADNSSANIPRKHVCRLLTLLPGDRDDDIHIELHKLDLVDKHEPKYEALSYTWGLMDNPSIVFVGREKKYTLSVTRNLDIVLRYLRHRDRSRTLWIDAICINQHDIAERSNQVRIMADIYSLATDATIWLGPEQNHSDHAMEILTRISSAIRDPENFNPNTAIAHQSWDKILPYLPDSPQDFEALSYLISREWFERLWIRQEIFHTSEVAIVQCGHRKLPWKAFRNAIWVLRYNPQPNAEHRKWYGTNQKRMRLLLRLFYRTPYSLRWLRDNFGESKCSDQRDRIYGTLGMLFPEEKIGIVPDYSLSVLEVYRGALVRYVQSTRNLSILRDVGPSPSAYGPQWLSWVPDWSEPMGTVAPDFLQLAGGPTRGYVKYSGGNTLRVAGIHIGIVKEVWCLASDNISHQQVRDFIRNAVPSSAAEKPYPGGGSLLEAYAYVLTEGELQESFFGEIASWYASMDDVAELIQSSQSNDDTVETVPAGVLRVVGNVIQHKAVFRTEDGYIGLGPKNTAEGDHVCAFLGCEPCMILRESREPEQYRVLGASFVHGYASGEAFLGRLPNPYRFVTFMSGSDMCLPGYLHHEYLLLQKADPRVLSLPVDDVQMYRIRCRGIGVGGIDLSPDVLQGLGINVRYFHLI